MNQTSPVAPSPVKSPSAPRRKGGALRTVSILAAAAVVVGGALVGTWAAISSDGNQVGGKTPGTPPIDPAAIAAGRQVTMQKGCVTCHSEDGSIIRGPSYKGLYGSTVTYTDGTTGHIDDNEVREALTKPAAKVIDGFEPLMPPAKLTEEETKNLIAYLRSIGAGK